MKSMYVRDKAGESTSYEETAMRGGRNKDDGGAATGKRDAG